MLRNVGGADRVVRVVLGLVIIAVGLYFRSWWGLIGIVPGGQSPAYGLHRLSFRSAATARSNKGMNWSFWDLAI